MEIEIMVNDERLNYSHSLDTRLRQKILSFQNSGKALKIVIYFSSPRVNLALAYPPSSLDNDERIEPRPLRPLEKGILDEWDRCGLGGPKFTLERLIQFLHIVKP